MRCFLGKFTQLTKILHDRRSRRSWQISTLYRHTCYCSTSLNSITLLFSVNSVNRVYKQCIARCCLHLWWYFLSGIISQSRNTIFWVRVALWKAFRPPPSVHSDKTLSPVFSPTTPLRRAPSCVGRFYQSLRPAGEWGVRAILFIFVSNWQEGLALPQWGHWAAAAGKI